ncbi:MAG: translocation/assembly module TamB domain-containing protein [Bacteroidota bacterium]
MRPIAKKLWRFSLRLILGIGLLLVLVLGAIQYPPIQQKIVDKITSSLSQQLGNEIQIGTIHIQLIQSLQLKDLLVTDLQKDTLLYIGQLDAQISLFSLLQKDIELASVKVQKLRGKLYRPNAQSDFNYQFLLNAFTSEEAPQTTSKAKPWAFGLKNTQLSEVQIDFIDPQAGIHFKGDLKQLDLGLEAIDLTNQALQFDQLSINQARLFLEQKDGTSVLDTTTTAPLSFPSIGWTIGGQKIALQNSSLQYTHPEVQQLPTKQLDVKHLNLMGINLNLEKVHWSDQTIGLHLQDLSLKEQCGLAIDKASGQLRLHTDQLYLNELQVKTPNSQLALNATLQFDSIAQLATFSDRLRYQLELADNQISPKDLEYLPVDLGLDLARIPSLRFALKANGQGTKTAVDQLTLDWKRLLQLRASGQVDQWLDEEQIGFKVAVQQLKTYYPAWKSILANLALPAGMDSLGSIHLSGLINGDLKGLAIQNLNIKTDRELALSLDGQIRNWLQSKQITYDLNIDQLKGHSNELAFFTSDILPSEISALGRFLFQGKLRGDLHKIKTNGQLQTDIGRLSTKTQIAFQQNYRQADYQGMIRLDSLQLAALLGDSLGLGPISMAAQFDGQGLHPDSLLIDLDLQIDQCLFQQYPYQNLTLEGIIDRQSFEGSIEMEDPNLQFQLAGLADVNDEQAVFKLESVVDTFDLDALKWGPYPMRGSLSLTADLSGRSITELLGQLAIREVHLSQDSLYYHTDSLQLWAEMETDSVKRMRLESDIIQARLMGKFSLSELPNAFLKVFDQHFSMGQFMASTVDTKQSTVAAQQVQWDIQLIEPTQLSRFFSPTLEQLDTLRMKGELDSRHHSFALDLQIPQMKAAGWTTEQLQWQSQGDEQAMRHQLTLPSLRSGEALFKQNQIKLDLKDQQIHSQWQIKDEQGESLLAWGADMQMDQQNYLLRFKDSLQLSHQIWTVDPHQIRLAANYLWIDPLVLRNEGQKVYLKSFKDSSATRFAPIELGFRQFALGGLSEFTNMESLQYDGQVNGQVKIMDYLDNLHYLTDIQVNNLIINDSIIGHLNIYAAQPANQPDLDIDIGLRGGQQKLDVIGRYGLQSNEFDLDIAAQNLPLLLIDPFMVGSLQQSRGHIDGQLKLSGPPNQPKLDGQIQLEEVSTFIDYLKTRYTIPKHQLRISEDRIDFGQMTLLDSLNNQALFSGHIQHNYFQEPQLFLNFKTNQFQFLNTQSGDDDLFYGQLYLAADAKIRGPVERPRTLINAQTKKNSRLTVQVPATEAQIEQADYVIFGRPDEQSLDSVLAQRAIDRPSATGVDLELNLDLSDAAELIVVVDPLSGDQLRCRGNAAISVKLAPSGEMDLSGTYTIVEGDYQFNYQGLVKRKFQLQAGGQLNFIGDPMDTRFNLTAIYRTQASIYELIQNETSLSDTERQLAQQRTAVEVWLSMQGDLNEPKISFDIRMPSANNQLASSAISRKLSQLREDETALNQQVFGLLFLNSFISNNSASASLSTAGENIALSSVSNLISNQLNRLADKYLEGVGLHFDLESYQDQYSEQVQTSLGVGINKSLFSNRLRIKIGGVVQLEGEDSLSSETNNSSIAGDFVLEYQLTSKGDYLLRVFRKSDTDEYSGSNIYKTGIGVSYRKSFGK